MAKDANQNNKNEGLDEDILQSKKDVLRAKDIIPSIADVDSDQGKAKVSDEKTQNPQQQQPPELKAESGTNKTQIPKFDLAEQIMSQQRKVTAVKRKGPGQKEDSKETRKKTEAKYHLIPYRPKAPENKLIAEIVARDIEELCRDN